MGNEEGNHPSSFGYCGMFQRESLGTNRPGTTARRQAGTCVTFTELDTARPDKRARERMAAGFRYPGGRFSHYRVRTTVFHLPTRGLWLEVGLPVALTDNLHVAASGRYLVNIGFNEAYAAFSSTQAIGAVAQLRMPLPAFPTVDTEWFGVQLEAIYRQSMVNLFAGLRYDSLTAKLTGVGEAYAQLVFAGFQIEEAWIELNSVVSLRRYWCAVLRSGSRFERVPRCGLSGRPTSRRDTMRSSWLDGQRRPSTSPDLRCRFSEK